MKIPVRDQKCVKERFAKINKVAQNQLMRGMVCSGSSSTIIVSVASAGGRVGIFFSPENATRREGIYPCDNK